MPAHTLVLCLVGLSVGPAAGCREAAPAKPTPTVGAEWTSGWRDLTTVEPDALAKHHTVFVACAADWDITSVSDRKLLEDPRVQTAFALFQVVRVLADDTHQREGEVEQVRAWMQRFDRYGVPFYVVLPKGAPDEARVLPWPLTVDAIIAAVR